MAIRIGQLRRFFSTTNFLAAPSLRDAYASLVSDDTAVISPSKIIYVSGLSRRTISQKLFQEFSKVCQVEHAKVLINSETGFSFGYGFVHCFDIAEAKKGIMRMKGQMIEGFVIDAKYYAPKGAMSRNGGGGEGLSQSEDEA